jgi:hypothetical protein
MGRIWACRVVWLLLPGAGSCVLEGDSTAPGGGYAKTACRGREWLKYPKKIKRLLFNKLLDNETLDAYN